MNLQVAIRSFANIQSSDRVPSGICYAYDFAYATPEVKKTFREYLLSLTVTDGGSMYLGEAGGLVSGYKYFDTSKNSNNSEFIKGLRQSTRKLVR